MAEDKNKGPVFFEGTDYDFRKDGQVLRVKEGKVHEGTNWKVEAEGDWVTIFHGKIQMIKMDASGFNNFLGILLRFSAIARQIRADRAKAVKEEEKPEEKKEESK